MSIYMQYAPYKLKGDWESSGRRWANGGEDACAVCPEFAGTDPDHQIITPQDLEDKYGLTGGHIFHGELRSTSSSPCARC